jgi:2-dehydro-3-deoxyphosphogluconate aldolase/(4S)-4-hydroxy-2-oxoglutarate aldolase
MREEVIRRILEEKLIAIMRGMEESKILPLAQALHGGGIHLMEITFNQAKPDSFHTTARAIASIREAFGGQGFVGAGTVLTPVQAQMAADAGASFIVSPDVNADVIRITRELGMVSLPGALTPTECVAAHGAGADFIKLFPLGNFGPAYLKALKAPLSHLKFLGVGGISEKNAGEFLAAGAAGFGVGGNLVNKEWIDAGRFDKITELAEAYVAAVKA